MWPAPWGRVRACPACCRSISATLEDSYYEQALGLLDGGVDLFQVETCQDMLQAKAALRALNRAFAEKRQSRPVSLLVTLEKNRMLLGTDIATALATFLPFPLFAFGVNCGTGPEEMRDAVRALAAASPFPLAVMPNAGLPNFRSGKYVYDLEPAPFARLMGAFRQPATARPWSAAAAAPPPATSAPWSARVGERARARAKRPSAAPRPRRCSPSRSCG